MKSKRIGVAVHQLLHIALALVLLAGILIGISIRQRPSPAQQFTLYVQNLEPTSRLVVLNSLQKYEASKEFTARLLAIVKVRASIELTAWADVHYYVDFSNPAAWTIQSDRKTRTLTLETPPPACFPPAVKTETIEIKTKGANLVTNTLFRLKEEAAKMQVELSQDLMGKAQAAIDDPEIRAGMEKGLEQFARAFCTSALGYTPERVLIRLGAQQ